MNFSKYILTSTFAVLCLLFSLVTAAPVESRDVYVPPILYPHAGTVWHVGQRHNVTWDVSNPPKQITNKLGRIVVRKGDLTNDTNILAQNFDIFMGKIEVTVPDATGDDIQLVLFGDSGNFSPKFTIKP